jgi:hypothetical protein
MSSAFYPQGMNSFNNRTIYGGYKTWKGKGVFSNPVGITSSHIRPLTNKDPGNVFPTGFGLPRPLKQYRRGTAIPIPQSVIITDPNDPAKLVEQTLIDYNVNHRLVKSSTGISLGGGDGGTGLISNMISMPGSFIVKDNSPDTIGNYIGIENETNLKDTNNLIKDCKTCQGVGVISGWYPINNLTEKPEPNVTNPLLCCNQQRKAIQRVLPTSTNVKKNYYQTTYMYLYNRCQTFQQREFNFLSGVYNQNVFDFIKKYPFVSSKLIEYTKPGDPVALVNLYVAQCNPNNVIELGAEIGFIVAVTKAMYSRGLITNPNYEDLINLDPTSIEQFINFLKTELEADASKLAIAYLYELATNSYNASIIFGASSAKSCKQVYYKPNNPQFAKQGGVASSTRTLKLNVDTITTNAASIGRLRGAHVAYDLKNGQFPYTPFIYKYKAPICQASTYVGNPFFFQGQPQNKKICSKTTGDEYKNFVSVRQHSAGNYIGATQP